MVTPVAPLNSAVIGVVMEIGPRSAERVIPPGPVFVDMVISPNCAIETCPAAPPGPKFNSSPPVATGGIQLNVGPAGANGQVSIAQLGDITISTKTGPRGITMEAVLGPISITTPMTAELVGATGVTIGSAATPVVDIKGVSVNVGGSSSPALLAKDFLDLFKDHTHPSPNGPTGPLSPKFAPKLTKTMAKKVFLS